MKKLLLLLICIFLVTFSNSTFAKVSSGMSELQASLSITNTSNGSDSTSTTGIFGVNFFILDWLSLGGSLVGTLSDSDNYTSQSISINAVVDFYLAPSSSVIPFVGVLAGATMQQSEYEVTTYSWWGGSSTTTIDDSETNFSYGAHAGLKIFIKENASLNLEVRYLTYEFGDDDITQTQGLAGFSIYL
ncbi:hypothetical protein BVX93_01860 [bacterium B13(2017)]|nr:hypothetical protein BVX93_01860 [bacterium B13(2017)]